MSTENEHLLPRVIERIALSDERLGARMRSYVTAGDPLFHARAEDFLGRYRSFVEGEGTSFDSGIDCFLRLHHSVEEQRVQFMRTGRYQNSSFEEVNQAVYANPEVMRQHMHGLVFAQFLWPDQYRRFQFFSDHLPLYSDTRRYLEIGGGHALYVTEAARVLPNAQFDVVDISSTSLHMAKGISRQPKIRFHMMDVFDFPDQPVYDFITMGEVLEHVERPQDLLSKIRRLLAPGGRAYITTPANAPMLDHIYLFRNAREIREMFTQCGFTIEREVSEYAVKIKEQLAEQMKLPLMFAAFVTPG
jgi:2-polyprenyl-3-methyl-5-hydroxy-6-metoxy-1,4-benzoquinol methylase